MDFGLSFTYMFKDEDWLKKLLLGVIFSLIPIVNLLTYGYLVKLIENVRDGDQTPLPEWDDLGGYFMDGVKVFVGFLVYALPVIVLSLAFAIFAGLFSNGGDFAGVMVALSSLVWVCGLVLFGLLPVILMPALGIMYARNHEISDMFRLGEMWDMIKADFGNYLIMIVLILFVLPLIASLGMIACFIGVFFTSWWSYLAGGHMAGQYAAAYDSDLPFKPAA
jgi:hypothetical protein